MIALNFMPPINQRATKMIDDAIKPLIYKGCKIERLQIHVSPHSEMANHPTVETRYGILRIYPDGYVPKGMAYVIEDPGRVGRGFAWVSRRKPNHKEIAQ